MTETIVQPGSVPSVRRSRWESTFLFLTGALASTVMLKLASIQYLELIYLFQFAVLFFAFFRSGLQVAVFRPLMVLGAGYALFGVCAFLLALAALRSPFYLPPDPSPLQLPILITISRLTELAVDVGIMLYMTALFRERPDTARFTMRVYYWVGVASVFFSILSYPLDLAKVVSLGVYGDSHRFRGFYNEGGPYGLYLITVLAVGWALLRLGWERPRRTYFSLVLLGIALLLAQSKAAWIALMALFLLRSLFARSLKQRLITVSLGLVFIVVVSQTLDFGAKLRLWQEGSGRYEQLSHLHVGDGNFIQGRVAGLFIVPRMIVAHPLTGIGWGNYGIVRNDPLYRGAAEWAEPDEPGLGVFGLAAEMGVPLLVCLLIALIVPYFWLRSLRVPDYVANLALLQPVVHIFGSQLNLTYPWIVTAFALGVGYALKNPRLAMPAATGELAAA